MNCKPVLAFVAVAVFGACLPVACSGQESAQNTQEDAPAVEVRAVMAKRALFQPALELSGVLMTVPEKTAILSCPIAGQISAVDVREGQAVHAGDTIVLLDTRVAESDLARANAALAEAEANLALLQHGALPEEIEAARQDAQAAAAMAKSQAAKLSALEPLHVREEISAVQFDQARAALASAEAASVSAAQRLKLLASGTRPEAVEQAKAQVAAAAAEVAAKQVALEQCTVRSPLDGTVLELTARMGMFVDAPAVIARIADLSTLFAQTRVPSRARTQVREGASVSIIVDGPEELVSTGSVVRMGKEADPLTGDVEVFIAVPNEAGFLQPGLSCAINISLPEIADALVVPVAAVNNRNGDTMVTVIRENRAYETKVELAGRTHDLAHVGIGLESGDIVAISGGYALPEGQDVETTLEPF